MSLKKASPARSHFVPSGLSSEGFDKGSLFAYSPVAAMLDRFKKAEAAWTQEKAQLRHDTEVQRKKASKLQLDHDKLQTAHRHQTSELKSVMAALNERDEQLAGVRRQLQDVSHNQASNKETLIDMIAALKGERQELSELLDSANHKANMMQAANSLHGTHEATLKDKVLSLESDRARAEASTSKAKAEVADLQQCCDKLELQNKLLQKLLEIQQKHNRVHVKGLHRFLESDSFQVKDQLSSLDLSTSSSLGSIVDPGNDSGSSGDDELRHELLSSADLSQGVLPPSLLLGFSQQRLEHKRHVKSHKRK